MTSDGAQPDLAGGAQPDLAGGAQPDGEQHLAAWRAAYALEQWYFLARGYGDQVTPFALEQDGRGFICVFTTPQAASDFGVASGLDEAEAGRLLAIPPGDATEYLLEFVADGVHAVALDPGTQDEAVLLAALPHVRQLVQDQG
ncbi:hypothetical protein FH969_03730 [Miniimonas arenae]|uniref:SseB family protein n=1 Tax=Miniimonas arenae TaxID=676201 RepID=A0A5C5BER0_9MICO|nr:hypothetical protein [Miniimonas arenae]TNU76357.1 hypothetical protein FH969_03730 [Miniimonas arenae]